MRLKQLTWDRKCLWCKTDIEDTGEKTEKVCTKCQTNRDWLLNCIRQSERPFNYVSRVEQKERNERIERLQREEKERIEIIEREEKVIPEKNNESNDKRIDNIESLLLKLIENLGGVN